jgi:diadenosine tetraphosphate (Ap4A) HIT family hydrolase
MECPFCNINNDINPIIFKGNHTRVIPSNPSLMFGHLLVIPIRHLERFSELYENEILEITQIIQRFEKIIIENISSGCDIRQHYRPYESQGKFRVNHLHFHLMPRDNKDNFF